jgi:putative endonuclease
MVKADASSFSNKSAGDRAETRALQYLQEQGLSLMCRNYRVGRGPGSRGGEIDLILRERSGTLVFVEVRSRARSAHGGASASIDARKRARIVLAAQHYLLRYRAPPPCRFDVIAIDGGALQWLKAAFDSA